RDLPEYEYFMQIPSIRYGRRVTQNFNKLIGRYPGADGFKTGFICASGYNLVASATRNGKRLIAVVLGSSSGQARAVRAAQLLERGFGGGNGLGWLKPALGTVDNLAPIDASPPNLREEMCSGKRKRPASDEDPDIVASNGAASGGETAVAFFTAALQAPAAKPSELIAGPAAASEPILVYTGPTKSGPALIAAVAADTDSQKPAKRGKKSQVAAKKPDADAAAAPKAEASAKPAAKPGAKTADKPAAARHANAKPEATAKPAAASAEKKPAAAAKPKPVAASEKPAPKPAKPNAPAKPKAETKPAG
ncbi:MAG: peptidase M15, partial [Bradyrhizobium sp.]|nr:peptidase M15 [Bradyrhizobium sp.]